MNSSNFSVSNFTQKINKKGFSRPNKYKVEIPTLDTIYCHTATLPGKTIENITFNRGNGPELTTPDKVNYEPVDFTFYVDKNYTEKIFFDNWMNETIDPFNHLISYKNGESGYAKDCTIITYNEEGYVNYTVQLINAYPTSVSEIELNYESHEPVAITVNLTYDYWKIIK